MFQRLCPKIWNNLSQPLKQVNSSEDSRHQLKAHMHGASTALNKWTLTLTLTS